MTRPLLEIADELDADEIAVNSVTQFAELLRAADAVIDRCHAPRTGGCLLCAGTGMAYVGEHEKDCPLALYERAVKALERENTDEPR